MSECSVKIEKFWNQAFIAALIRLPAEEAKLEADKATELCIEHWQSKSEHLLMPVPRSWAEGDISQVPFIRKRRQPDKPGSDGNGAGSSSNENPSSSAR